MGLDIVILAAGQGSRMRSTLPKVLHDLGGAPLLAHVLETARRLQPSSVQVVVGHGADQVRGAFAEATDIQWTLQAEQRGTGHALMQALPHLRGERVLVLYGDVPLIARETLQGFIEGTPDQALGLLTVHLDDPSGYGRILRDDSHNILGIVEHKDANAAQREICEINTGIMLIPAAQLESWLEALQPNNQQGEYYLTDIVGLAVNAGTAVVARQPHAVMEVQGVNDRVQLAQLERFLQHNRTQALMLAGATLRDPARVEVRGTVEVGRDVEIDIDVIFEGHVILKDGVRIGPYCVIRNTVLHQGVTVKAFSHLDGAEMQAGSDCGPYARLRPGSQLGAHAHVGNFVELKNARLGEGAKAGHLSYLGDADIGARTNIGAGTITCNYDGANKHKTQMGEDVFIGSNSSLVAPVTLGDGVTTGAGSTITGDVPAGALAVGRARQRVIESWKRPQKKS